MPRLAGDPDARKAAGGGTTEHLRPGDDGDHRPQEGRGGPGGESEEHLFPHRSHPQRQGHRTAAAQEGRTGETDDSQRGRGEESAKEHFKGESAVLWQSDDLHAAHETYYNHTTMIRAPLSTWNRASFY